MFISAYGKSLSKYSITYFDQTNHLFYCGPLTDLCKAALVYHLVPRIGNSFPALTPSDIMLDARKHICEVYLCFSLSNKIETWPILVTNRNCVSPIDAWKTLIHSSYWSMQSIEHVSNTAFLNRYWSLAHSVLSHNYQPPNSMQTSTLRLFKCSFGIVAAKCCMQIKTQKLPDCANCSSRTRLSSRKLIPQTSSLQQVLIGIFWTKFCSCQMSIQHLDADFRSQSLHTRVCT